MGSITSKMPLFVWDHLDDRYDFAQLAQNWQVVAFHDHTPGRGVPIPAGALAPGSVSATTFDTSVLSYISQHSGFTTQLPPSGTYSASSGDLVFAGATGPATATVQLPTPTQGARVGVVADTLVTAANPVTITATGGAHIFGLGVNNVTSMVLGTIGAHVLLHCDGVNWWIYAGLQDTGWVALTLLGDARSPTLAVPIYPPGARLRGDMVYLRGQIQTTSTIIAAQLPTNMWPAEHVFPTVYDSGTVQGAYSLDIYHATDPTPSIRGKIIVRSGGAIVALDGASFPVV